MTATQKRQEAVRIIRSREKKNKYGQGRPGYFFGKPEGTNPGVSDCSDTVRQCILRAAGIDIGGNTSAQIDNARRGLGIIVEDNRDGKLSYPTPSKLKLGDAIYYLGNAAHTWNVGHVELNTNENECMGHGSGTGPSRKNRKSYSQGRTGNRKYLCTVRWIKDDADDKPLRLGDRPLTKGCKGEDVGELQSKLVALGHDLGTFGPSKDGVDCDYGVKTAAAVKSFQKENGLAQSGDADLSTIKAIIDKASGKPVNPPAQIVKISGGNAYIRTGPGTSHRALGVAANGTTYDYSGQITDGWVGVKFDGKDAWISAKYAGVQ